MSHTYCNVILGTSAICLASLAYGQGRVDAARRSEIGTSGPYSVEIKPLPTILSAIPGVAGIGLGGEALVSRETAVYTEVNYLDSNLSGRTETEARNRAGDGLYPNRARAVNFDIGGRFYTSPHSSSWFGGAKLGYSTLRGQWFYHDATLDQKTASLTPGISAGYRWKWDNSMLLRLGAGAAANLVQFQEVDRQDDSDDAKEGQDKLDEEAHTPILANLDLGLGYMF